MSILRDALLFLKHKVVSEVVNPLTSLAMSFTKKKPTSIQNFELKRGQRQ